MTSSSKTKQDAAASLWTDISFRVCVPPTTIANSRAAPPHGIQLYPLDHLLGGQFRFDLNTVALTRDEGTDDQRATAELHWRKPFIALDGQMFTLQADVRGDVYHIDNDAPLPSDNKFIERGIPQVAARLALAVCFGQRQRILRPRADRTGDLSALWGKPCRYPERGQHKLRTRRKQSFQLRSTPRL